MNLLVATDPVRARRWVGYVLALLLVAIVTAIRFGLGEVMSDFPFLPFFPPVLLAALLGGLGPGILSAVLSVVIVQYFFIEPAGSIMPASATQWVGLGGFIFNLAIMVLLMEGVISAHRQQVALKDRLQDFNHTLESTVDQRTAELKKEMADHGAAQAQLRQLQKMETIGHLTGGVAHDFNNMLAIIIGSLDMAERRLTGTENPKIALYLQNAKDGAQRAAVLTGRLLAFSRQQPLTPEIVDGNKLVGGMSELLRRTIGEDVQIETVLGGGLWRAYADLSQLENAILNLAVNARDAMPGGGKLTIETANTELDDRYARLHSEVNPGQYVMISVSDTGTGMSHDVIERAFDPFYTTKGPGKGTGLGLSQVYGYVKQTGGHIKIYSEIDRGTVIKIYLPRYLGGAVTRDVVAGTTEPLPQGSASQIILVVEDEDQVRHMTVDALRELGYTVVQASNGKDALQQLELQPRIDLLLTDIIMPEMNGKQLADLVTQKRPGLPVLYTTGYTRNAIVHNGVLDHGVALLPKPFTVEQLALKLHDVLNSKA
jgi:signal transduction histidine kinase/CheY-like chemotaxis protein